VIVEPVFAAPHLLEDLESNESRQAAEDAKYHDAEHKSERLSAFPPYKDYSFSLAEEGVFTRAGGGRTHEYFHVAKARDTAAETASIYGRAPNYYICHELVIFGQ
jgi:hypothetical protein